jgi:magnesium chelatase family protein
MTARNPGGCCNSRIAGGQLQQVLQLEGEALAVWEAAIKHRQLSARAGARLLRVAQTIADLNEQTKIGALAIAEALTYRSFDQGVSR